MSKNIEKFQIIQNKMDELIDKVVFIDGSLIKIKNYSLLKLYGYEYKCDNEYKLKNDLYTQGDYKIYKHFTNEVVNKKFKMLNSDFYGFTVVSINSIDNIYFIDRDKKCGYNTSNFKNNKLEFVQDIESFIYSMFHRVLNKIHIPQYYELRKQTIRKFFNKSYFNKYKEEIKKLISLDNYILFLKLYIEYKKLFHNGANVQELHDEIIKLIDTSDDESDDDDENNYNDI
jgi:hypothetical protein